MLLMKIIIHSFSNRSRRFIGSSCNQPVNSSSYAYYLKSRTRMANPRKGFTIALSQSFDGDTCAY